MILGATNSIAGIRPRIVKAMLVKLNGLTKEVMSTLDFSKGQIPDSCELVI